MSRSYFSQPSDIGKVRHDFGPMLVWRRARYIQVPYWLLRTQELRANEKLVFCAIRQHLRKNAIAYPSQARLSQELGISRPTVVKAVGRLCELGFLSIIYKTRRGKKDWFHNVYKFTDKYADRRGRILKFPYWLGRTKLSTANKLILAFLVESEKAELSVISDRLNILGNTVRRCQKHLELEGYIDSRRMLVRGFDSKIGQAKNEVEPLFRAKN
jgi:DNA-binding MarR family transcriptional regulator